MHVGVVFVAVPRGAGPADGCEHRRVQGERLQIRLVLLRAAGQSVTPTNTHKVVLYCSVLTVCTVRCHSKSFFFFRSTGEEYGTTRLKSRERQNATTESVL